MLKVKQFGLAAIMLSLAYAGCGKEARKLYEKEGGFSYDPPPGWGISEVPGMKYHFAKGPFANGFAPNINVVEEGSSGSLSDYTDGNVSTMTKVFQDMKILKRDSLTTLDGRPGMRLAIEDNQMGKQLRQVFYFFENGSRKYVVTCTSRAVDGDKFEAIFDASVKTFRVH